MTQKTRKTKEATRERQEEKEAPEQRSRITAIEYIGHPTALLSSHPDETRAYLGRLGEHIDTLISEGSHTRTLFILDPVNPNPLDLDYSDGDDNLGYVLSALLSDSHPRSTQPLRSRLHPQNPGNNHPKMDYLRSIVNRITPDNLRGELGALLELESTLTGSAHYFIGQPWLYKGPEQATIAPLFRRYLDTQEIEFRRPRDGERREGTHFALKLHMPYFPLAGNPQSSEIGNYASQALASITPNEITKVRGLDIFTRDPFNHGS